jgi:hypothetical protein
MRFFVASTSQRSQAQALFLPLSLHKHKQPSMNRFLALVDRDRPAKGKTQLHLQWQHNTVQTPLSYSCRSHEETKESNWHFGIKQ